VSSNHTGQADLALVLSLRESESLRKSEEPVITRHISLEPGTWWEWQCASCEETFDRAGLCPECHAPLRRTEVSIPFIWIG
jgi:hypothetical protein